MKLSVDLRIDSEEFCKALDGYIERVKQLEDALKDARGALLYVREVHGELYGATQPPDGPTHAASSIIVISPLQQLECEY